MKESWQQPELVVPKTQITGVVGRWVVPLEALAENVQ
jgi:hypothetical protein